MRTKAELIDLIELFKEKYLKEVGKPHDKDSILKILEKMCEERDVRIVDRMLSHLKDNDFFELVKLFATDVKKDVPAPPAPPTTTPIPKPVNAAIQKKTNS